MMYNDYKGHFHFRPVRGRVTSRMLLQNVIVQILFTQCMPGRLDTRMFLLACPMMKQMVGITFYIPHQRLSLWNWAHPCVCLCVWVCEIYIVHYLNSTGLYLLCKIIMAYGVTSCDVIV